MNKDMLGKPEEITMEQIEEQNKLLASFKDKKSTYPSMWKECYDTCKQDEDFVLGGNQLTPQQASSYGFGTNYRMPNMLKPYINNQANQTLQNDYRAVVTPNGGGADIGKARLREQALRGIQRVGGAPEVYNYARRGQLAGGIHYSKVVVDYANYRGMEQEYTYEDVQDTYSVYPDPYVQKATFEDMNDFLIKEDVPKSKWKEKTGRDWSHGSEKTHSIWFYWVKKKTISDREYLSEEGNQGILESELPMGADGSPDVSLVKRGDDGVPFTREVSKYEWKWYVMDDDADQIYSEGEWLGTCAPLVACTGEKVVKRDSNGNKVFYRSLAHDAKEPQMVYTICENIILMQLAKSPYPHYEIADGSIIIKQLGEYRQNAVIADNDVIYKPYDEAGKPLPKPNRVNNDGVDQQLIALQQVQLQKIERILGIYDAALGQKTNEKSGVAIRERAKQSNLANYHFEFNFIEYVRQLGYVVLESMPHYLSVKQVIPMLDDDDKVVMQEINGPDGIGFTPDERYRMVIEVVPDSDTNREAEAEMLMKMADSPVLGPLIMQTPGAAAEVVSAQKGKYAQKIGKMMADSMNDPEKQQMKQQIDDMKAQGQKMMQQFQQLKISKDFDIQKEQNRHDEEMAKIQAGIANDADKNEIGAYNAETGRMKVDMMPQTPESILTNDGEIETDKVQSMENMVGELHPGENPQVHRGLGELGMNRMYQPEMAENDMGEGQMGYEEEQPEMGETGMGG